MRISNTANVLREAIKTNKKLIKDGVNPNKMITPFLVGDPGIGKTSIVEQVADELGVECRSVIIAQYDPADLAGLPIVENSTYVRTRPNWLPDDGEGILFLDELVQACTMSQNLMAQLINERRIGEHELGEGWVIVAAGNKSSNKAGTSQMPSHLKDRLMTLEVEANLDDTVAYFNKSGINEKICGYLRYRPDKIAEFDASADACPSPRSWARMDTVIEWDLSAFEEFEAMKGTVGEAAANDFKAFQEIFYKMPDPDGVIANPKGAEIPSDPAIKYALMAALAARADAKRIPAILKYVDRIKDQEFAALLIKDSLSRDPGLVKNKDFQVWARGPGKDLLK